METKKYLIHCKSPATSIFLAERLIEVTGAYLKAEGRWEGEERETTALIPWGNVLVAEVDNA